MFANTETNKISMFENLVKRKWQLLSVIFLMQEVLIFRNFKCFPM